MPVPLWIDTALTLAGKRILANYGAQIPRLILLIPVDDAINI